MCADLFVRGGKVMGGDHFILESGAEMEGREILSAFLKQYYYQAKYIPSQILLPEEVPEKEVLTCWLAEKKKAGKVVLKFPQRGYKKSYWNWRAKTPGKVYNRKQK